MRSIAENHDKGEFTLKYFVPNLCQYGLKPDDRLVVFWTKEISLPHFNKYRVKFRKVYSGSVKEISKWIKFKTRKKQK